MDVQDQQQSRRGTAALHTMTSSDGSRCVISVPETISSHVATPVFSAATAGGEPGAGSSLTQCSSAIPPPATVTTTKEQFTHLSTIVPDINYNINEEDFDDEEDDDFDDDFSDEFDDEIDDELEPSDMTKQLLEFAVNVNSDIQKYFGNRKDDDACDVYEDKWTTKKSGRELYLADILKIANGGSDPTEDVRKSRAETKKQGTGKLNTSKGLGPLEELFKDVGGGSKVVTGFVKEAVAPKTKRPKRLQTSKSGLELAAELQGRKLPPSFWIEPKQKIRSSTTTSTFGAEEPVARVGTVVRSPATPDFSDLLETWSGEECSPPESHTGSKVV